jgi:hypothetical protein
MTLRWHALLALTVAAVGCKPYDRSGDFYAGPMDPQPFWLNFPACDCTTTPQEVGQLPNDNCTPSSSAPETPLMATALDGTGTTVSGLCRPNNGIGYTPGQAAGQFTAVNAFVNDQVIGYYAFPFVSAAPVFTIAKRGSVYVFDAPDAGTDSTKCNPPANYTFDAQRDYVRLDRQGNIFEEKQVSTDGVATPADTTKYIPIYQEVPVTSGGYDCQSIRSAEGLVANGKVQVTTAPAPIGVTGAHPFGIPSGNFLAFSMIDPSADVRFPPNSQFPFDPGAINPDTGLNSTGLDPTLQGPQRWGYYNHFLAAYIDGGYYTMTAPPAGSDPGTFAVMEQMLFAPDTIVDGTTGMPAPGGPGLGLDVLEGVRGDAAYQPLCHVFIYPSANNPQDPTAPTITNVNQVMAQIQQAGMGPFDAGWVFCFQPKVN